MMYRAIDPALLRRVAAENGCDVRAFNLGVSQLRLTKLRYIKDRLPAEMFDDYDLIVLSPLATSRIKAVNWPSNRVQHFSDWEEYKGSLIDLWEYPETKKTRTLYHSALLTGSLIYHQLGIGRLTSSLQSWPQTAADNATGDTFDGGALLDFSRDGFVALDDEPHEQFKCRGEVILKNGNHFEKLKTSDPDITHFEGPLAAHSGSTSPTPRCISFCPWASAFTCSRPQATSSTSSRSVSGLVIGFWILPSISPFSRN